MVDLFYQKFTEELKMTLKVASFNIYHCEDFYNQKIDFDAFAELIKSLDADIIGLNEVHGKGDDEEYTAQTEELAVRLGYNGFFAKATDIDGNNPFGNAVLTRKAIKSLEVIPIPDPEPKTGSELYETRCLLKMELTEPQLTVLITHFGLNHDEHLNAVKTVLENCKNERCIFMGDLNVRPENDVLDPIRKVFTDSASVSDRVLLTYPADVPNRKIDYIFATPDIKILSVDVPEKILSDHLPITAEIEV